ncbi:MAG: alkaline phosphatase family protein, partial [bacterium]|nr:alkaline phosphatase family protein [bacterium]
MHLKEAGIVIKIFPDFSPRIGGSSLSEAGFEMEEILNQPSFFDKIKAKSFNIIPNHIAASDFQKTTSKKARILGYRNLNQFFGQIKKAINSSKRRKYIYAYWWKLDSLNHEYGANSGKANKHFEEIDKKFSRFIKSFKNSAFIITSDHGFINTPKKDEIKLEDHPKLKECLTLPLCGEGRVAYCYVHPSKAKEFERYVETKLKKHCFLFKSRDLINRNYFGLFEPNPKLFDRVGDYILILKKNYLLKDSIEKNKKKKQPHIGHHGGVSKDEMLVPLIFIKA